MASTTQHVQAAPEGNAAVVKGGYWLSSNNGTFPSSKINTSLFTHIYYASLIPIPNKETYKLEPSPSEKTLLREFISGLQQKVKTLITIGSASDDDTDSACAIFADMASTKTKRKGFIDSSIQVARDFKFDGLDLDWKFPKFPKQMKDFGDLLHEWRAAVEQEAKATGQPTLLLTAKVYFAPDISSTLSYPAPIMDQYLDWINGRCYDYHSAKEKNTGAPAAFFDLQHSNINSIYGLQSWVQSGMPVNKLIMGLPLYGITWQLEDPKVVGIGAPAVGPGPGNGILPYNEIKEIFNPKKNNAMVVYDQPTISTYSYFGILWVGYDDVESTKKKIKLAHALGLGGYFVCALHQDDKDWKISTAASEAWDNAGGN